MQNLLLQDIREILSHARHKTYSAINSAMVEAYWQIGKRIVQEEQNGNEKAEYGKFVIATVSKDLTENFGKGFSERSIREYRQFYLLFPDFEGDTIRRTLFAKLSWSHFQKVLRVQNESARNYYLKESAENNWSVRTLDRNISTLYYERLLMSQNSEAVKSEMQENSLPDAFEFIKNPTVLEFLNLPSNFAYTERELEKALIDNLQKFILELGKGFAFVDRQKYIRTENNEFFIDLVFYNFKLKCFVLIDLKTSKITHQDIGQMDMYVRMYDDLERGENDNPTMGIVLCTETDADIAKYSILKGNEKLFATKYKLFLPTEEELRAEIEREKLIFQSQFH